MNQSGEQNAEVASSSSSSTSSSIAPSSSAETTTSTTPSVTRSITQSIPTSPVAETALPKPEATKKIISALKRRRTVSLETTAAEKDGTGESSSKKRRQDDGVSEEEAVLTERRRKKRRVIFDGVTVFFFRRTQGFTSVPSQGGSTLGMAPRHEQVGKFSLKQFEMSQERTHRAILRKQLMDRRCQQLRESSPCSTMSLREAESDLDEELDNININDYYFLQPIPTKQRRLLLRRSGVKKIDNTEKMELKRIRLSRESCGCDCQGVCHPETCMCCIAGIKCQVDRQSFPCGCAKEGCQNSHGRIEFNPSRVRTHFIQTVMRLDMEQRHDKQTFSAKREQDDCFEGPPDVSALSHPLEDWGHHPGASSSSMYSGSLNGRDFYGNPELTLEDDRAGCSSSSLYSKSCNAYGSGNSLEENIPVEVHPPRQHDLIPQMLQFNESEDESALTQPIAPMCNVPLPTMPCYDSSEDNLSSTSDATSSSEVSSNYELNECGSSFNLKSSPDYSLASSLVQSPEVNSLSHSSTVEGTLPHLTPLEVSNVFSTSRQVVDDTDNKTYTELKQPDSYSSSGFTSGLYNPDNSAHSSYSEMFMPYDNSSKVADTIPLTLPALTSAPLVYTTCHSPTSSSRYTVMSTLSTVDSLADMQETALATSKLSSVSFGMKDDPSSSSCATPEALLYSTASAGPTAGVSSSSFPVVPRCDDADHSNEATAAESTEANTLLEIGRDNPARIPRATDNHGSENRTGQDAPAVCSSSGGGPLLEKADLAQSQGDHESTDTCSVESSPREPSVQDASNPPTASGVNTTEDPPEKNATTTNSNLDTDEGGILMKDTPSKSEVAITSQSGETNPCAIQRLTKPISNSSDADLPGAERNSLVTCSNNSHKPPAHEGVDPEGPINSTVSTCLKKLSTCPLTNGAVPILSQLPREALKDATAVDLSTKIQVLRGNSEGDATPSISPDSLSPDGAMSDDPFRQAVDPSGMDESSFSSSDSMVAHMTAVTFPELSSAMPLVQAGASE